MGCLICHRDRDPVAEGDYLCSTDIAHLMGMEKTRIQEWISQFDNVEAVRMVSKHFLGRNINPKDIIINQKKKEVVVKKAEAILPERRVLKKVAEVISKRIQTTPKNKPEPEPEPKRRLSALAKLRERRTR